jgi:hypothetical protein
MRRRKDMFLCGRATTKNSQKICGSAARQDRTEMHFDTIPIMLLIFFRSKKLAIQHREIDGNSENGKIHKQEE